MIKSLIILTAILFAPLVAHAQQITPSELPSGTYKLDLSHASLTWKVNHLGLSRYTARFTDFDATIQLDASDISKTTLAATVNPASIETDYPNPEKEDFDGKLRGADWLNVAQYPEIKFISTRIEKTSDKTGRIFGNLTFLGVTKPLVLDVTFVGGMLKHPFTQGPAMGFSATATLKRSDWGFVQYIPNIGDEVTLTIETEFQKAP